jgi:hypothetical protein
VQKDFPTVLVSLLCVNCHHDALYTEFPGAFFDEFRRLKRGGIDENLIGAGCEYASHFICCFEAATNRERDEGFFGHARG